MITNHQDELDFAAMIIAYNKDAIWSVETKWVSKQSVAWIPCFGWAHYLLGDLFIKRRWEDDGPHIKSWLQKFGTRNFKRIVIFPEGTRRKNMSKQEDSHKYALEHNLPPLDHVLYPRTKGFVLLAKYFKENPGMVDHVYDVTLGYLPDQAVGLMRFLRGFCYTDIHIHFKRHALKDLPDTEEGLAAWLTEQYQQKDKLLAHFYKHGRFEGESKKSM